MNLSKEKLRQIFGFLTAGISGFLLEYAIEIGDLTEQEGKDIWCKNVLDWLNVKQEDFI